MLKILIITGSLFPVPGNNTNLLCKLIPFLCNHYEIHLLAPAGGKDISSLPSVYCNLPVHWVPDKNDKSLNAMLYRIKAAAFDRGGLSDVISSEWILCQYRIIQKKYNFDAVISTSQPYPSAVASSKMKGIKKILYLMDPPESLWGHPGTTFRNRSLRRVLKSHDLILTTTFIRDALLKNGYSDICQLIEPVGFPMIENHYQEKTVNDNKIRILFCGWLCSELRSPDFFINIVSRLDERFSVTFMGKECENLKKHFPICTRTRAELITIPNQPYKVALQALQDADVLINIGNNVPVHVPSKTLEYINTGKPFVNFFKMEDCPTLFYTNRYPLCLNQFEGDDIEEATERFVDFCLKERGKTVDRAWIESEYQDCTPEYISQKISDKLINI